MIAQSEIFIVIFYLLSVSFSQCRAEDDFNGFLFGCKDAEHICPNKDVTFWHYTRSSQDNPTELKIVKEEQGAYEEDFVKRPVIILVHGFTGHRNFSPNTEIRPALFEHDDYNVISVDYEPLARFPCYLTAVRNLQVVANCTAQMIDYLVDDEIVPLDAFHAIGFSLGAHVVGMIGNYLTSGKLRRVTALDPAKPLFITASSKDRIDPGDADFVDVIHTDSFGRGLFLPTGHVDFFMNGGFSQPGCYSQAEMTPGSCNHVRAPIYFAESINSSRGFWGYKCPHWYAYILGFCRKYGETALMGFHTPNDTRGLYFVRTNSKPPYAKGNSQNDEYQDDTQGHSTYNAYNDYDYNIFNDWDNAFPDY
ncbi:phospholipase A1-like isoform X2 [Phlebotomus papatasi]|uniref:phospholipase A1-like isoform X2 n=1 Tax=Phlebotomus papatasi TaxID=29031 RepID=UPI00248423C5|nr:phospholipase A1-like isoform X2 [Phlebotomus papatasi]